MSKTIILAINSPQHGKQVFYYKLNKSPVSIGRGFSNDIILDDPFVCENHMNIIFAADDNAWFLESFETKNGFELNKKRYKNGKISLNSGDILRIGKTIIHVYDEEHSVNDTEILAEDDGFLSIFENRANIGIFFILAILGTSYYSYLNSWNKDSLYDNMIISFVFMLMIIIWAGIWAIISRINKHRSYFYTHITIFSFFTFISLIVHIIQEYILFLFHENIMSEIIGIMMSIVLLGILIYVSLIFSTNLDKHKAKKAVFMLAIGIIAGVAIISFIEARDFTIWPEYANILKPYLYQFGKYDTIQTFMKDNENLFDIMKVD